MDGPSWYANLAATIFRKNNRKNTAQGREEQKDERKIEDEKKKKYQPNEFGIEVEAKMLLFMHNTHNKSHRVRIWRIKPEKCVWIDAQLNWKRIFELSHA